MREQTEFDKIEGPLNSWEVCFLLIKFGPPMRRLPSMTEVRKAVSHRRRVELIEWGNENVTFEWAVQHR